MRNQLLRHSLVADTNALAGRLARPAVFSRWGEGTEERRGGRRWTGRERELKNRTIGRPSGGDLDIKGATPTVVFVDGSPRRNGSTRC